MPKTTKKEANTKTKKITVNAKEATVVEGFLWDRQLGNKPPNVAEIDIRLPGDEYGDWGERYVNRKQNPTTKKDPKCGLAKMAGHATLEEAKKGLPEYAAHIREGDDYCDGEENEETFNLYYVRIERIGTAQIASKVEHEVVMGNITPIETGTVVVIQDKKKSKKKVSKSAKGKVAEKVVEAKPAISEFVTPDL